MTNRKKLIKFMIWKSKEIGRIIGKKECPKYFAEEDKKEILGFSDEYITDIIDVIKTGYNFNQGYDAIICPWCALKEKGHLNCHECGYGKRHGVCDSSNYCAIECGKISDECCKCEHSSDYDKLVKCFGDDSISDGIGINKIQNKLKSIFKWKEKI